LISNFFITINKPLKDGVIVVRFKVPEFRRIRDPSRIYSLARRIGYRLEKMFGGTFEIMGREIPDIVLFRPISRVRRFKLGFIDGSFSAIPNGELKLIPSITQHRVV